MSIENPNTNAENDPNWREYSNFFSSDNWQKAKNFLGEYTLLFRSKDAAPEVATQEQQEQAGKQLAGRGAGGFGWEVAAGTGAAGLGVLWTLGKALEYALLGWELDSNGWPKIDKQSIAHVDKWHNKMAGIKG